MNPRRGIAASALLFVLRVYKAFLSPIMPSACKFYPTCSQYAQEAVTRFGARRGMWLALKRLSRCRPFHDGGVDPVPDADAPADPQVCAGEVPEANAHEAQPSARAEEFAR
ncbi:MAG: membrane protein insertion efficiency factor YidD [Candidatus Acidiferrales bacterium]